MQQPIQALLPFTVGTLAYQAEVLVKFFPFRSRVTIDLLHSRTTRLGQTGCVLAFRYALIVLRADDNGQGGAFALFSLLKRQAELGTKSKVSKFPGWCFTSYQNDMA